MSSPINISQSPPRKSRKIESTVTKSSRVLKQFANKDDEYPTTPVRKSPGMVRKVVVENQSQEIPNKVYVTQTLEGKSLLRSPFRRTHCQEKEYHKIPENSPGSIIKGVDSEKGNDTNVRASPRISKSLVIEGDLSPLRRSPRIRRTFCQEYHKTKKEYHKTPEKSPETIRKGVDSENETHVTVSPRISKSVCRERDLSPLRRSLRISGKEKSPGSIRKGVDSEKGNDTNVTASLAISKSLSREGGLSPLRRSPRIRRTFCQQKEYHKTPENSPGSIIKGVDSEKGNDTNVTASPRISKSLSREGGLSPLRRSPMIRRTFCQEKLYHKTPEKSPGTIRKGVDSENETHVTASPRISKSVCREGDLSPLRRSPRIPEKLPQKSPRKRTPSTRMSNKRRPSLEDLGLKGQRRKSWAHDGKCLACSLCNKEENEMFHVDKWTPAFHMWNDANFKYKSNDCFCSKCISMIRKQFKQRLQSQKKVTRTKEMKKCLICDQKDTIQFEVKDHNQFTECFSRKSPFDQVSLCRAHYYKLKNFVRRKNCSVCQKIFRYGSEKKKCPIDIDIANTFLSSQSGKCVTLGLDDLMCVPCHAKILKGTKNELLFRKIENLKLETNEEDPKYALFFTASKMTSIFREKNACLLTDMLDLYHSSLPEGNSLKRTTRWLLSELLKLFGDGLKSTQMAATQYSKLLFFQEISCECLHEALYKIRQQQIEIMELKQEIATLLQKETPNYQSTSPESIINALFHVNEKLNVASRKIERIYVNDPSKISELNMDNIKSILPCDAWNFMQLLTMNGAERRSIPDTIHNRIDEPFEFEESAVTSRNIKRVFLISTIMNIINSGCTYPLPIAVTETVKKLSGSRQLVSILNKMGFCASEDTRVAFEHQGKLKKQLTPLGDQLNSKLFTVVTLDNLDFLSSWAMVTAGIDRSGWHGTTVCAMQPRQSDQLSECDHALCDDEDEQNQTEENQQEETYYKIQVFGDGRCLFRSLATLLLSQLQNTPRQYGMPTLLEMQMIEKDLADDIRFRAVQLLRDQDDVLQNLPNVTKEVLLERHLTANYASFSQRLDDVQQSSVYAGTLEIIAASKLLQTPIHVYQLKPTGVCEQVAILPDCYTSEPLLILSKPDVRGSAGHYDALVKNQQQRGVNVSCTNANFVIQKWKELSARPHENIPFREHFNIMNVRQRGKESIKLVDGIPLHPQASTVVTGTNVTTGQGMKPKKIKAAQKPSKGMKAFQCATKQIFDKNKLTMEKFFCHGEEILELTSFGELVFRYMFMKKEAITCVNANHQTLLPNLKCTMAREGTGNCEKSSFLYLDVLDEKADCKPTIRQILMKLFDDFEIGKQLNHITVVGDAKTYDYIVKIKEEYGEALNWVIPFIGDWHTLKNYQPVIMKIYWDAGLKEIAETTHRGATLTSLAGSSSFRMTHHFLMQVWEALYIHQIQLFEKDERNVSNISQQISEVIDDYAKARGGDYTPEVEKVLQDVHSLGGDFNDYCDELSVENEQFKFWDNFLKKDMFSYVSLYISMRSRNWNLRIASLKSMVVNFIAFDRHIYARLLPKHLADISSLPDDVIKHYKQGSFAVNMKGRKMANLGLDEAHEMSINKDVKAVLHRVNPKTIEHIADYLATSAKIVKSVKEIVGIKEDNCEDYQRDDTLSVMTKETKNVQTYLVKVGEGEFFQKSELTHPFTKEKASQIQKEGLLHHHRVGEEAYKLLVNSKYLEASSAKILMKKQKLQTFTKARVTRTKLKQSEKEKKLVVTCYKRTMALSQQQNKPVKELMQYLETPRAICTADGLPFKGTKSTINKIYHKRYDGEGTAPIIIDVLTLPDEPKSIIIEGMNLIYTSPLAVHKTFKHYAFFFLGRIVNYFKSEHFTFVHLLFDQSKTQGESPKEIERGRRTVDKAIEKLFEVNDITPIPETKWTDLIRPDGNRRLILDYLSRFLIENAQSHLTGEQALIVGGGFSGELAKQTVCVTLKGVNIDYLETNQEEADITVWLHAEKALTENVVIMSKDADISQVGLPLDIQKKIWILFNSKQTETKYIDMSALKSAIARDSSLLPLREAGINCYKVLQIVYIVSGCDYLSYFVGQGKASFFKLFYANAKFITLGTSNKCGNLCQTSPTDRHMGLLAMYRLIGCVYFAANRAALFKFESPQDLFLRSGNKKTDIGQQHSRFLAEIRKASWKGTFEDELLPSDFSLKQHWLRACWVVEVWGKALIPIFQYPAILDHGYSKDVQGTISCVWESNENIAKVRENVVFLTRGCSCKSGCKTKRCKCNNMNKECGPGCKCKDCINPRGTCTLQVDFQSESSSSEDELDMQHNESDFDDTSVEKEGEVELEHIESDTDDTFY